MNNEAAPRKVTVLNPYDLTVVDTIPTETTEAAIHAFATARDLLANRRSRLAAEKRITVLETAANLIRENADCITATAVRESGMPRGEARAGLSRTISIMRQFAARLRSNPTEVRVPVEPPPQHSVITCSDPVGVVLATSTSVDPYAPAIQQIVPAVAAGCPVIAQPNPLVPLTTRTLTTLLQEAGLPEGWAWCWVPAEEDADLPDPVDLHSHIGPVPRSGLHPASHLRLREERRANAIVCGDVDIYEVRDSLLPGCFLHAGQASSTVQRIHAHARIATRLATQMAMRTSGLQVGNPLQDQVQLGPMIRPARTTLLDELINEAVSEGGQLLTGGQKLTETLYAPSIVFNPPEDCRLMTMDVPGPVTCVTPWFEADDMLERVNASSARNRVSVYGRDMILTLGIAGNVAAATVLVNEQPTVPLEAASLEDMQVTRTMVMRTQPFAPPLDAEPA